MNMLPWFVWGCCSCTGLIYEHFRGVHYLSVRGFKYSGGGRGGRESQNPTLSGGLCFFLQNPTTIEGGGGVQYPF